MHRPRIGIPLCLDDRGRWRTERDYLYIDAAYAHAIDRAGGQPVHLPIQSRPIDCIADVEGLLLPGGDDLAADLTLGERPADPALLDLAPGSQVDFDRGLLDAARKARIPILGICYGMQLLARAGGGTLDIHLPTDRPDALEHQFKNPADRHSISIDAGTSLASICAGDSIDVNSLHHQGVREVGARHRVAARSPDGLIEAIEAQPGAGFELGVQWHPEKLDDDPSRRLFEAFVEASRNGTKR